MTFPESTHSSRSHFPHIHPLRTNTQQTSDEAEIASIDEHVYTWNDTTQEIVGLRLAPNSVQPVSFSQQRGVVDGWGRSTGNDVELRIGRDEESEECEGFLVRKVTKESGQQTLSFDRVHQGDEGVRIAEEHQFRAEIHTRYFT